MLELLKDGRYRIRYYADGRKAGRRIQETLPFGTTKQEAQAYHKKKQAEAAARKGGTLPAPRFWTLSFLMTEYVKSNGFRLAEGTLATYRANITHLAPALGSLRVDRFRPSDVQAYQRLRQEQGASNSTINREVIFLRTVSAWTVKQGWLTRSPFPPRSVPSLKDPESRTRFFSREEFEQLLRAQEARDFERLSYQMRKRIPAFVPLWQFLLMTGTRLGEALALTWENVDLETGRISIVQEKTGRLKELPISGALRPILEALPRGTPAARLFPDIDGEPLAANTAWTVFVQARELAGLPDDLLIHSLRHTFASWLASEGAPLHTISKLLGHSGSKMTERYAHLSGGALAAAAELITKVLSAPREAPAPSKRHLDATASTIPFKR